MGTICQSPTLLRFLGTRLPTPSAPLSAIYQNSQWNTCDNGPEIVSSRTVKYHFWDSRQWMLAKKKLEVAVGQFARLYIPVMGGTNVRLALYPAAF